MHTSPESRMLTYDNKGTDLTSSSFTDRSSMVDRSQGCDELRSDAQSYHGVLSLLPDGFESPGTQGRLHISQGLLLVLDAGSAPGQPPQLPPRTTLKVSADQVLSVGVWQGSAGVEVQARPRPSACGALTPGVVQPQRLPAAVEASGTAVRTAICGGPRTRPWETRRVLEACLTTAPMP